MNVYLSIGCDYKYDLAKWLIEREDVDEIYMDHYPSMACDLGRTLSNEHFHYVEMDTFRRHDAADCVNVDDCPMPSKDLIEKALKYESMAVHLGMRETNYPIHTYEESKRSYLFFFRLWNHVLSEISPGYIYFEEIPHCMSIYVMYVVARVKNIPVTVLEPTGIRLDNYSGGVYVYGHSIKSLGANVGEFYEQIKNKPIGECELNGKVKTYFERSVAGRNEASNSADAKKKWAEYVYRQEFAPYYDRLYNIKYIVYSLARKMGYKGKTGSFGKYTQYRFDRERELKEKACRYIKRHAMPLKTYDLLAELPDYTRKYIYYPLQQMPEATLFPLAGIYAEQYNALQMLSRITKPYGVKIYVKEYFIQAFRDKDFWDDVKRLKNVHFIKSSVPSIDMIKGAIAVANATGTCLMEAVFENKPALAFGGGHNWKNMPGLFEIVSEKQGKEVMKKILAGYDINRENLRRYFYAIQERTIEYYVNADYSVDKGGEYDNTLRYMKRLIGGELDKIKKGEWTGYHDG